MTFSARSPSRMSKNRDPSVRLDHFTHAFDRDFGERIEEVRRKRHMSALAIEVPSRCSVEEPPARERLPED